ncbi:L-dopachrome tautomerase-related protein [Hymenobacter caeli]|uniref:Sugar lactone lactonase YvrE n=1 Tax=Hymenobacter caeli TaxID=2735894 RepID=A0ABX2FWV5_9BACT|nr:L-dopachrome tautomerase-related protein [Hymenobacter caeli]NRT20889.1 sugar lactone lactonase YvrE [Hymenobacter caeli]
MFSSLTRAALLAACLPAAAPAFAQTRPETPSKPLGTIVLPAAKGLKPVRVAAFPDQRVTGVTVSRQGRIFVNFPLWEDGHRESVAEIVPGQAPKPYPDAAWNSAVTDPKAPASPAQRFVCVQSVVVDDQDHLWVLDPASPKFTGVVPGGAKLVEIDLATNKVLRTIVFTDKVAPSKSYLNDVRFDTKRGFAYLTESGTGALVVLNLKSGRARRVLETHPSVHPEPGFDLAVDGYVLREPDGKKPNFQVDGIELSADGNTLYYQALMGRTMYRIGTEFLRDSTLSPAKLAAHVQKFAVPSASDGYGRDAAGNLYTSGIEDNSIHRVTAAGKIETIAQGPEISWPDTFGYGPGNTLYFTTSQIQTQDKYHKGKSTRTQPYGLWKLALDPAK